MDNLPSGFSESLTKKFFEIFNLYEEVKKIVLLAEYENKEQKYIISSVNELRNTLDHIMRIFGSPESLEKNFDKAKGHLYRAGYDAYEIIAISKLTLISNVKDQFGLDAITIAYPDYFKEVVPLIKETKNELIFARANKKIDNGLDVEIVEEHFSKFQDITTKLIKIVDKLNLNIDGIQEVHQNILEKEIKRKEEELRIYQDQQRKNRRTNWTIFIVAPTIILVLGGLILLIIEYKYFVHKESKTEGTVPKTEQLHP
ncbi:MAG: hypothetical protein WCP85_20470 [Mariniphaga sp.]